MPRALRCRKPGNSSAPAEEAAKEQQRSKRAREYQKCAIVERARAFAAFADAPTSRSRDDRLQYQRDWNFVHRNGRRKISKAERARLEMLKRGMLESEKHEDQCVHSVPMGSPYSTNLSALLQGPQSQTPTFFPPPHTIFHPPRDDSKHAFSNSASKHGSTGSPTDHTF